jgi:hypothetical protein
MLEGGLFNRTSAKNLPQLVELDLLAYIELDKHENRAVQGSFDGGTHWHWSVREREGGFAFGTHNWIPLGVSPKLDQLLYFPRIKR